MFGVEGQQAEIEAQRSVIVRQRFALAQSRAAPPRLQPQGCRRRQGKQDIGLEGDQSGIVRGPQPARTIDHGIAVEFERGQAVG